MQVLELGFDSFGWWDSDTIKILRALDANGNNSGWHAVSAPPEQKAYFVVGALTVDDAIKAGLQREIAEMGRLVTPYCLIFGSLFNALAVLPNLQRGNDEASNSL